MKKIILSLIFILCFLSNSFAKTIYCFKANKGNELIKSTIKVANGRLTCAEALGHKEFVMTKLYRSA